MTVAAPEARHARTVPHPVQQETGVPRHRGGRLPAENDTAAKLLKTAA